jgi:hypothetical protein
MKYLKLEMMALGLLGLSTVACSVDDSVENEQIYQAIDGDQLVVHQQVDGGEEPKDMGNGTGETLLSNDHGTGAKVNDGGTGTRAVGDGTGKAMEGTHLGL